MDRTTKVICLERQSAKPIAVGNHCSIGRAAVNTIVLSCARVSRRHAIIRRDARDRYILMDLGSNNGTYVNGERIDHLVELQTGDVIQIGSDRLVFRINSAGLVEDEDGLSNGKCEEPATFVPCWLLLGNRNDAGSFDISTPAEDDCYKTVVGWLQLCQRIVQRHKGLITDPADRKLFAYWPDPHRDPAVTASVVSALRQIRPVQTRFDCEFRLALHFGSILIGEEPSRSRKSLIGTEISSIIGMHRLAWKLSVPCIASEEANRRTSALAPSVALVPEGDEGKQPYFNLFAEA